MANSYREPDNSNPLSFLMDEAFNGVLRELMVCLPGRIMAFDESTQLAQVQCGIQRIKNGQAQTIAVIENVPVCFPGNNQWYMWHEITPGETEGLIHFSQRAADTWINQGGVTEPVDFRMFDQADAFFEPGYRSVPGAIPGFVNSGCGMSSYDGQTRIHMTSGHVEITASSVNIASGSLTHNGTNIGDTHVHSQGNDSDNDGQQDTDGPH